MIPLVLPLFLRAPQAEVLSQDERRLPVIMYHSVLKDRNRAGKYVVSPDTLLSDLLYLKQRGYETVLPADLAAFAEGSGTLPEKPVMITFDDGHLNNLIYVLPILEELDMRAVVSVVGEYTDRFTDAPDPNPNYAYLSWEQVKTLSDSGRFAIGNHTDSMHSETGRSGCMRCYGESVDSYKKTLLADVGRLQSKLLEKGIPCITFAYPFGRISPEAREVLAGLGFAVTLTCFEHVSVIEKGDPESLFGLGRFNRAAGDNSVDFFRRVLKEG